MCTKTFTTVLVTVAQRQKELRCLIADKQFLIHREEEILICATTLLDIKVTVLDEKNPFTKGQRVDGPIYRKCPEQSPSPEGM